MSNGTQLKLYYLDTTNTRQPVTGWGVLGDTIAGLYSNRCLRSSMTGNGLIGMIESAPGVIANIDDSVVPISVSVGQYILSVDHDNTHTTLTTYDPRVVGESAPATISYTRINGTTEEATVFDNPTPGTVQEATTIAVVGSATSGLSGITTAGFVYNGFTQQINDHGIGMYSLLENVCNLMQFEKKVISFVGNTWQVVDNKGVTETTIISAYFCSIIDTVQGMIGEYSWSDGGTAVTTALSTLQTAVAGERYTEALLTAMVNLLNTRSTLTTASSEQPSVTMVSKIPYDDNFVSVTSTCTSIATVNTKTHQWGAIDLPSSDVSVEEITSTDWLNPYPIIITNTTYSSNTDVTIDVNGSSSTLSAADIPDSAMYYLVDNLRNSASNYRFIGIESTADTPEYAMDQGKNGATIIGFNYICPVDLWEAPAWYQTAEITGNEYTASTALNDSTPTIVAATTDSFLFVPLPESTGTFVLTSTNAAKDAYVSIDGTWNNRYAFEPLAAALPSVYQCQSSATFNLPLVKSGEFTTVFNDAIAASTSEEFNDAGTNVPILVFNNDTNVSNNYVSLGELPLTFMVENAYEVGVSIHFMLNDISMAAELFAAGNPMVAIIGQFNTFVLPEYNFEGIHTWHTLGCIPLCNGIQSEFMLGTSRLLDAHFYPEKIPVESQTTIASLVNTTTGLTTDNDTVIPANTIVTQYTTLDRVFPVILTNKVNSTVFTAQPIVFNIDSSINSTVIYSFSLSIFAYPR